MIAAVMRAAKVAATAAICVKVAHEVTKAVDVAWDRLKERKSK